MPPTSDIIQFLAMLVMLTGVVLVFAERIKSKRGMGARTIQLVAVFLLIPMILILALQNALQKETVATLLGALIGYILSGIGDFKGKGGNGNKNPQEIETD